MAITPAFQADNAGSIPAARSKFSSYEEQKNQALVLGFFVSAVPKISI